MSRRQQLFFGSLVLASILCIAPIDAQSQEPRDERPRERGPREGGPREGGFREDGPRDQQGPRGRRGQFGGGFNIQFGPGARPGALLMLLGVPEVQKEITLDDEQRKEVEKLQTAQREKMDAIFRDSPPGPPPGDEPNARDLPRGDFREKLEELNKENETAIGRLLKEKQLARLKQLQLQSEGVAALSKPEVADKLALTDEQKEKLRDIQSRGFTGFGPPQVDPKDKTDALALLTADQKSKWEALIGAEVKLPDNFGPGGFGGPGGNRFFGGGPMGGQQRKVLKEFDKNSDGWLNLDERKAARETLAKQPQRGRGGPGGGRGSGGPGGRGPFGGGEEAGKPGPKVSPDEVARVDEKVPLYDPKTLRTIFLDFDSPEWEVELEEFHNTDVEVPATLTVDGKKYPLVGVRFRGMSSYGGVSRGSKRSLNVSLDMADAKQRLLGYKTLNLLNSHSDPTFMHTVLYSHIARQYMPAPKANFVKLVINGESWGIYSNAQQFDKILISENYPQSAKAESNKSESNKTDAKAKSSKVTTARWKVRGSPGGDGGLNYVGDNVEEYKRRYEIKSGDKPESWQALIKLCRTLSETPIDQLEAALKPMLDIDEALWFLALDNALINGDGYWVRASDYSIYLDENGRFHIIPHDMNETFQAGGGPGMGGPGGFGGRFRGPEGRGPGEGRGGEGRGPEGRAPGEGRSPEGRGPEDRIAQDRPPEGRRPEGRGPNDRGPNDRGPGEGRRGFGGPGGGGGGLALDPLFGATDTRKPLRSRLLAVPTLREKYLQHVRTIANDWLDWEKLGPLVAEYEKLIAGELEQDTRKLTSYDAFKQSVASEPPTAEAPRGRGAGRNLKSFADTRRKSLLDHAEIKKLPTE